VALARVSSQITKPAVVHFGGSAAPAAHTQRVVLRLWVSYTPTGGKYRKRGFCGLRLPR